MTASIVFANEAPPLWDCVSVDDYSVPADPITRTVKKRLAVLWQLVQREHTTDKVLTKPEHELRGLSEQQLARVAPAPAWNAATAALQIALEAWLEKGAAAAPVVLLVGPPHSGYIDILRAWAEQETRMVFQAPSPQQVLAGDESWFPSPQDAAAPWVFPALECTYLRHTAGIGLVRRFLNRASSGALGRGIIGCDSWAWAYLQHIWHGHLPISLTLQAFDEQRLAQIFHIQANRSSRKPLLFRQANNGHYVLPPAEPDAAAGEKSRFLQALAAHSRGNLGVAWAIWRASLATKPDEEITADTNEEVPCLRQQTVWVKAWEKLSHPELPPQAGRNEAFVLHTLLLHNGLSCDSLQQCLPLASNQVMATLLRLEEMGLVTHAAPLWQVTARGYPAVRQFLLAGGYLTDAFLGG